MSFSTTYLTPTSIEQDLELTHPTTHRSGSIYTEDMYLTPKLESDPREFYVDENRDLTHESGAYMMEEGAKQPRDRMKLNRILNNGSQVAEEYPQEQNGGEYQSYAYQDNSIQSFQPVGMPVSTFSSPMP
ncbi:hypothetical protein BGZ93_009669, partial [Podila epicladia]